MVVDPGSAEQVDEGLLSYLRERIAVDGLRFAQAPEAISDGWETYIYAFELDADALPGEWRGPLILRMYPGERADERAEREGAVQRFVAARGYPAPVPIWVETDATKLGLPFMVMPRAPGKMLVDQMSGRPGRFFGIVRRMAELHVDLHEIDTDGCTLQSAPPLVERKLGDLRDVLEMVQLGETDELQWLRENEATVLPEERSICHCDFHPLNILIDDDGNANVIDWSGVTLGDRHYDIACTLVLVSTAPFEGRTLFEKLVNGLARGALVSRYQRGYRKLHPIDKERLRYWEAFRAYEWWALLRAIDHLGPGVVGIKSDTLDRMPKDMPDKMLKYARKRMKG